MVRLNFSTERKGKINCSGSKNILPISSQMKALNNQNLNNLSMAPLMELLLVPEEGISWRHTSIWQRQQLLDR